MPSRTVVYRYNAYLTKEQHEQHEQCITQCDLRDCYRFGCGEWAWDWRCYTGKIPSQSSLW